MLLLRREELLLLLLLLRGQQWLPVRCGKLSCYNRDIAPLLDAVQQHFHVPKPRDSEIFKITLSEIMNIIKVFISFLYEVSKVFLEANRGKPLFYGGHLVEKKQK